MAFFRVFGSFVNVLVYGNMVLCVMCHVMYVCTPREGVTF